MWNVLGEAWSVCVWVWGLAKYRSRSWSPVVWTLGPCQEVVLGGVLEAWRSGLGVWNVAGGGPGRAFLTLTLAPSKSPPRARGAWTWGPSSGGVAGGSAGGMEAGTGGVERCRGRPGPCLPNPNPGPVQVPVLVPWGLDLGAL